MKNRSRRKRIGRALLFIGLISFSISGWIAFEYFRVEQNAINAVKNTVEQLQSISEGNFNKLKEEEFLLKSDAGSKESSNGVQVITIDDLDELENYNETLEIGGKLYIGQLVIKSQNLVLPIFAEWDTENAKVAPCRFSGSIRGGDLIIAGHNYRTQFGRLRGLSQGDQIDLIDPNGIEWNFFVSQIEYISKYDVAGMIDIKNSEDGDANALANDVDSWDLTLFTCTMDKRDRVTVRCVSKDHLLGK